MHRAVDAQRELLGYVVQDYFTHTEFQRPSLGRHARA
jgi:hypothetical protein